MLMQIVLLSNFPNMEKPHVEFIKEFGQLTRIWWVKNNWTLIKDNCKNFYHMITRAQRWSTNKTPPTSCYFKRRKERKTTWKITVRLLMKNNWITKYIEKNFYKIYFWNYFNFLKASSLKKKFKKNFRQLIN